jgi:hypothetical protein
MDEIKSMKRNNNLDVVEQREQKSQLLMGHDFRPSGKKNKSWTKYECKTKF